MYNLMRAGLARLKRNVVFWFEIIAMLIISAGGMLNGCRQSEAMEEWGYLHHLDDYYFLPAPYLALFCAAFICLFLGTEHSEGTIRNKLVVGCSRLQVYLSSFLVCLVACESFVAAWLMGGLVGIPFLGGFEISYLGLGVYILLAVLFVAALTGIFVLQCMLSTNKAQTAVAAIFLALALILAGATLYNALGQPETVSEMLMTVNGIQVGDPRPNPDYVGGIRRVIYQFLVESLPTGQGILMTNEGLCRPVLSAVASVVLAVFTTVAGIFCFRKKDLR